jgi:spoIIIJ-associated protein
MEWVETTGRTLAQAVDAALDQLGVDETELEYEVLAEPRPGLFGRLGGREARIRARVKPVSREKPGDRRRRARSRAPSRAAPGGREHDDGATGATGPGGGRPGGGGTRGRRRRRSPAAASRGGESEGVAVDEQVDEVPVVTQAETAKEFARGLVEALGVPARVTSRVDEDTVLVEVEGEQLGLLVGPKGATLTAIEELVRTVVQRRTGGHGARVNVDVGGYRAKRRDALGEFSRRLARRVLEDETEQSLEPMSPADRKVVHDAVAEIEGVTTISEGEEPRRRVVIRKA